MSKRLHPEGAPGALPPVMRTMMGDEAYERLQRRADRAEEHAQFVAQIKRALWSLALLVAVLGRACGAGLDLPGRVVAVIRLRVHGNPACSVEGCDDPVRARGWCNRHYLRWWQYGDPLITHLVRGDDHRRFWAKVNQPAPDACWEWQAVRDKDGYGSVWFQGAQCRAPRVAWTLTHGFPIPPGQVVRHTCDNPPCCNPAHLTLGTPQDNNRDRVERERSAAGNRNGSRLHPDRLKRGPEHPAWREGDCRNGHARERRYVSASGERICRDCVAARKRRYRARKAATR